MRQLCIKRLEQIFSFEIFLKFNFEISIIFLAFIHRSCKFRHPKLEYGGRANIHIIFMSTVKDSRTIPLSNYEPNNILSPCCKSISILFQHLTLLIQENKASKAASSQSGALFDADSPFFKTILIAGSAVLGLLLLIGFLWDRLYWRRQRELEERKRMNEGVITERTRKY